MPPVSAPCHCCGQCNVTSYSTFCDTCAKYHVENHLTRIATLETQLAEARAENLRLRSELAQAQGRIEGMTEGAEVLRAEIERLKATPERFEEADEWLANILEQFPEMHPEHPASQGAFDSNTNRPFHERWPEALRKMHDRQLESMRERAAKVADEEFAGSKRNAAERETGFRIAAAIRALPLEDTNAD